mmetsp:Transcript_3263/g.7212  ORF Transcript_3263/g.7212 Transcript_3263/m.7212 type:complete len:307 (+) Transcript_3263:188-1108(+)
MLKTPLKASTGARQTLRLPARRRSCCAHPHHAPCSSSGRGRRALLDAAFETRAMKRNQANTFSGRSYDGSMEYDFGSAEGRPARPRSPWDIVTRPVAQLQRGIESRVEADPDFLFKIIWEIVQDQFIIVLTVLGSQGLPTFWTPEQCANACLLHATAILNDALLMYFLAPVAGDESGSGGNGSKKALAHMFEPSAAATLPDRARCWLDKFFLYAPLGLLTAVVSSVVMAAFLKESLNFFYLSRVGLVGLLHLGISSNTRYQIINGLDVLYYRMFDKGTARGATIGSRLVNQVAGGKLFLMLSTLIL